MSERPPIRRGYRRLLPVVAALAFFGACSHDSADAFGSSSSTTQAVEASTSEPSEASVDVNLDSPEIAAALQGKSSEYATAYGAGLKLGCNSEAILEESDTGIIFDTQMGKPVQDWANQDPFNRKVPLFEGITDGEADAQRPDPHICDPIV